PQPATHRPSGSLTATGPTAVQLSRCPTMSGHSSTRGSACRMRRGTRSNIPNRNDHGANGRRDPPTNDPTIRVATAARWRSSTSRPRDRPFPDRSAGEVRRSDDDQDKRALHKLPDASNPSSAQRPDFEAIWTKITDFLNRVG